ncbi:hypothetical protein [Aquariibacter albus]|uniref:Uncharacterized protein n=1 Tax=Aquariibacter albus TaxID=2759899 RepID=A0A839HFL3_9BURK|nr:hypothetical protein [Aquariibacter albus]MBB1160645.1 hypothetical protein [Aquariibacter albus]
MNSQHVARIRNALLALGFFVLQSSNPALAEIDLGKIFRDAVNRARVDQGVPGRPPSYMPQGADAQQCTKAANWLALDVSNLPPEFAENGRFGAAAGRAPERRINYRPEKTGPLGEIKPSGLPRDNWLLEDSRFVAGFGKPYDQLSASDLQGLQKLGFDCRMMGRTPDGVMVDMGFFGRAFSQGIFPQYAKGVQSIRAARQEIRDAYAALGGLPPTDDGYKAYQAIAADAPRLRGFMSAADLDMFDPVMAEANERVAKPALERLARGYIETQRGYEGMVAIEALIAELTGGQRHSPRNNNPTVKALEAKQEEIALDLQKIERARVDALGSGLVGLERGVAYSNEIEPRYRKYIHIGPINALWEDFIKKRHAMIGAAQQDFGRRISQASSEADLNALVARYIPFELDQQTAAGTALLTKVAEQKDEIEKRRILGSSYAGSAAEKVASSGKNNTSSSKVNGAGKNQKTSVATDQADDEGPEPLAKGEPSESVMYDLVKKRFDDQAAKINELNQNCASGPQGNDVVGAMMCLGAMANKGLGGGEAIRITKFEKLGCDRASGKPGFICDYIIGTSGGITRAMGPTMAAIYGSGGAAQARFLKTKSGWIVFFGGSN